jgi:hypothetical protein
MVVLNDAAFAVEERTKAMKRLISAALIASTVALALGTTAASAQPYRHGGFSHHGGYSHGGWRGHGDNGALIGLGVGLFALGAIAAASQQNRYYDRYEYGPPPPPPPPAYGPAYGYGY